MTSGKRRSMRSIREPGRPCLETERSGGCLQISASTRTVGDITLATAAFDELIQFLDRLRSASIHFSVDTIRPNGLLVMLAVPGQRWEVEFFADGNVEVEKFTSDGTIHGKETLEDLFAQFSD
jgi:hypothetical protein